MPDLTRIEAAYEAHRAVCRDSSCVWCADFREARAAVSGPLVVVSRVSAAEAVDQTILASDPTRQGNCVSACAATHLGLSLESVPHFVELDTAATVDGSEGSDRWWWLLVGFMAGHGLWPVFLGSVDDAESTEIVWVAGTSPRGVLHQVLFRAGRLWHDPHPSRAGVLDITEVVVWRARQHNHQPTPDQEASDA